MNLPRMEGFFAQNWDFPSFVDMDMDMDMDADAVVDTVAR